MSEMSKIIQGKFTILFNRKVGPEYFKMAILAPRIVREALPGQFVHLRCQNSIEPLLRRPFSFHRLNGGSFEILYKAIGRGTNLLAKKRKGDTIDVLGPSGNGFDIQRTNEPTNQQIAILIAGGIGVAPLLALAERLAHSVEPARQIYSKPDWHIADRERIIVLIGAKTKRELLCAKDFKKLGAKVYLATDDGSQGYKGLVTGLLQKVLLTAYNLQLTTIYACGSKLMLKELTRIAKTFRVLAYGSLEENMACGVGACLGCAIRTKDGYRRVCKDGPVFNLQEIFT